MSHDITLHHHFTHLANQPVRSILLKAETDAGRDWCVQIMGQMADPIIDRFGLDVATGALTRAGLTFAWTVGKELEMAIKEKWFNDGIEYADPIKVVECNDRLRITWDDGTRHGHTETWMLRQTWKRCEYSVNLWGSHPDAGNDDCYSGEDYVELYEAINAFAEPVADTSVAFITLHCSKHVPNANCERPNPNFDPTMDDNDDWRRETARQAGMGLGIDAYNDEMGNGVEEERAAYDIWEYNEDLEVGDRIKFRAVTRHSDKSVIRVINGFHGNMPTVRFEGWGEFVVRLHEIQEVLPR